jgi:PAS domain S-box-containing protein
MNGGITAILGYSVCEIRGMGRDVLGNLVHPHDRPGLEAQFSKLENLGDNQVLHSIYRMRHKNGKWRWIQGSQAVFARSDDGQVRQIIGTATDITENQRTQEELQLLSSRLLSYHDEERKKVAEELHEVTAQNLFAVTLNLRSLRQLEASTHLNEDFRFRFDALVTECEKLCERSLREVRTSSYSLRPPAQDQLGLSSTLRWYVDGFEKRSGIRVDLTIDEGIDGLPLELETDLFRVVQEGLGNVAQHSGSDVAIVQLEKYAAEIVLRIEDHGRGLPDLTNEREAEDSVGLGIPEMKQRLRQLGGRLEISSTSNGTILVARVPISSSHQVKLLTR